jgi:3-methyladenine DNA glycosylase Mpg
MSQCGKETQLSFIKCPGSALLAGFQLIIIGRFWAIPEGKTDKLIDLARGPGRLAAALQVDERLDGLDLCTDGPLWLGTPVHKSAHIGKSARIGITREVGRLLRFFEVGNRFVSGPRA